jgi:hypothetical protein
MAHMLLFVNKTGPVWSRIEAPCSFRFSSGISAKIQTDKSPGIDELFNPFSER